MGSTGEIKCMLCEDLIGFPSGGLHNFRTHMEYEHEVMSTKQELVLAITFLHQDERKVLINKMLPRIQHFMEKGESIAGDIFSENVARGGNVEVTNVSVDEVDLDEIQQFIDNDFSDSDDDEFSSVEVTVKQTQPTSKIEEITIGDTDSEEEEDSNIDKDNEKEDDDAILPNIKREEDIVIENPRSPEEDHIEERRVQEDIGTLSEPLNIQIQESFHLAENSVSSDTYDRNDDDHDEDYDDEEALEILQNISFKMEIEDEEVGGSTDNTDPPGEPENINLVEKLMNMDEIYCRLCFSSFSNKANQKRHEETVHINDQEALSLTFFTLKDLSYSCNMCPQIPGFLTENILNTHKKLQHRVTVKNTTTKCETCQKVMKNSSLKSHMLTHTEQEKKHECSLCYKKFLKLRSLENHQKVIHSKEAIFIGKELTEKDLIFHCNLCGLKFVSDNILKCHQKTHEERSFNCQFCTSSFENFKVFRIHCIKIHGKKPTVDGSDRKFKCKLCYSGFTKATYLTVHQKIHKEDQEAFTRTLEESDLKFKCPNCDKKFVSKNILSYHINKVHKELEFEFLRKSSFDEETMMYKCKLCYTAFQAFSSLHSHLVQSHQEDKILLRSPIEESAREHACEECELKFVKDNHLLIHRRSHENRKTEFLRKEAFINSENVFKCKFCYTSFKAFPNLKAHIVSVHKTEEEFWNTELKESDLRYCCEQCDKKFLSQRLVEYHTQYGHTLRRCKLCYKTFATRANLLSHQTTVHKNESEFLNRRLTESDLKFGCSKCEKKFVTENLLKGHERQHEIEGYEFLRKEAFDKSSRKYGCKLCYKEFTHFSYLTSHIQGCHKEETEFLHRQLTERDLKFECRDCKKAFVTEGILKTHQRKHENDIYEFLRKEAYDELKKKFACKLCYIEYKFFSNFVAHMVGVHREENELVHRDIKDNELIFNCTECHLMFVTEHSLNFHTSKCHDAQTTNYCKLCNFEFKTNSGFYQHKHKVHALELDAFKREYKEEDMVYQCSLCESKFPTEISLNHHYRRKHQQRIVKKKVKKIKVKSESQEKYCQLCYIMYKEPTFLKIHKKKIHSKEMDAFEKDLKAEEMREVCIKCSKAFYSKNTLEYHMRRKHYKHYQQSGKNHCKLCNLEFKTRSGFSQHKNKIHALELGAFNRDYKEEDMIYQCNSCLSKFPTEISLNYHDLRKHQQSDKKAFCCNLCYISFKYNSNLSKHVKTLHTNEMHLLNVKVDEVLLKYSCDLCDKRFVAEHILQYHKKYKHKEMTDKLTYCRLCYVNFKSSSQLKAHKKNIHSSKEEMDAFKVKLEKSSLLHGCKFCSKKFLTKNILSYHNIYSHKEERRQDIACEFCNKIFKWNPGRKTVMKNHMKNLHKLEDYEIDQQESSKKENETVKNFMTLLNSLK